MKLSAIDQTIWTPQRVLAFGDSKTGKTTLAAELAKIFKVHWFDLENGSKPLFKLPKEQQDNIELYKIPDTRSYPIAIDTMLKVVTGVPLEICHLHGKHACDVCKKAALEKKIPEPYFSPFNLRSLGPKDVLVVDSTTQLGISAINHVTRNQNDEYKPEWDDWRKQGFMLDRFFSNLQQSWYNVVCIAHTTMAKMEDSTKTKLVPVAGTDNFSRNVAKYFDHVIYCELGTGRHVFGSSTTYRPQVLTGSRTDVAIEKMEHASLVPFFDGTAKSTPQTPVAGMLASAAAQAAALAAKK
jgi:hypothetical protein